MSSSYNVFTKDVKPKIMWSYYLRARSRYCREGVLHNAVENRALWAYFNEVQKQ